MNLPHSRVGSGCSLFRVLRAAAFFAASLTAARAQSGTALITNAPTINGVVTGSIQQMTGSAVTLNSGGSITGNLYVPGVPTVHLNGSLHFGGTVVGTGSTSPSGYAVTLNSGSTLGELVTRTNPSPLPAVSTPPSPTGTRSVSINTAGQTATPFSTLKNLTLNSNVGQMAVPAGTYGAFIANSGAGFTFGVAGATQPSVYNLQQLTLNSSSQLQVVGPVTLNVGSAVTVNGTMGSSSSPGWLSLNISTGGLTINSGASAYAYVVSPTGAVTLNGHLGGGLVAQGLTLNSSGSLQLTSASAPSVTLTAPASGTIYAAPASITLSATASETGVTITSVTFYAGTTLLGTSTSAPYQFTWSNAGAGSYSLTAVAKDANGVTAVSGAVTITVDASIPYATGFEPGDGFGAGSLAGQNGWTVPQGSAVVTTQAANSGAQSVELVPAGTVAVASDAFASSPGETIVFCDFHTKPVADAAIANSTTFTAEGARFGFELSGGVGVLEVFQGNGSGSGTWAATPFTIPLAAGNQSQAWVHLTARLDFTRHTWDIYANGNMIAADIPFISSTSSFFSSFQAKGEASTASYLDDISIGATNPLFADVNNDGINDAWETAYGLSLAVNDRYLNISGDGVSILQDFISGTSPDINTKVTPAPVKAGLIMQLRADAAVVKDSNGDVSEWLDQSGNNNNASQSQRGVQPTLAPSQINGLPSVSFAGANSLSLPFNMMQSAPAGEILAVVKVGSNPGQFNTLFNFGTGFGSTYVDATHLDDFGTGDTSAVLENPAEIAQYFIYDSSVDATGTAIFRYNGVQEWVRTGLTVGFQEFPDIGGYGDGSFFGNIAEVIVYNRVLSDSERTSMGQYLISKYALPAFTVPATPTDLQAFAVSSDTVDVSWTAQNLSMHTVTTIQRKTGSGAFVQLAQINDASSYVDTGLTPGTSYTYQVTIQSYSGTSGLSNQGTVTTPANIADIPTSGMSLWLRSTVGTQGAGALSTWADQSGVANNATQVMAANQPAVVANQSNGLPVVRFNGPNTLELPQNMLQNAQAGEIIALVKIGSNPGQFNTLFNFGTGYGTTYVDSTHFDDFGTGDTSTVEENPAEIAQYYIYDTSIANGTSTYRYNGAPEWTRTGLAIGFQMFPDIGGYGNGSFIGDISEVIVYDRVLSDSELSTVYAYLGNRYGLPAAVSNVSTPVVTASSPVTGQVGTAFSYQVSATGSPTAYSATVLPPGLSIDPSTGIISGTPTAGGSTTLTIGATNFIGTGSALLTINVNAPPTVAITAPADGISLMAPATLTLTASASSPDSTIANVSFYQGASLLATVTGAGPTFTYSPSASYPAGTYMFTAVATDALGLSSTSAAITVNVSSGSPTPTPTPSPTPTPTPTGNLTASLEIMMPVNGCTEAYARPSLGAHYAGTTPVGPGSFHVYLDGRDYTSSATIQTGEMMFMPLFNLTQGAHNYRVDWVYNGAVVATDNVNFNVNSVIAGGGTYFQGQVAATTGEPLVNVRVLAAGQTVYTDVNGKFHFTNIPVGITLFHFQTDAVTNTGSYTPVNLGFEVLENQNTIWDRPVYLVEFDPTQGVVVQSNSPVSQTVTNPNLPGVQLVIPANTVIKFPDGKTSEPVTIINVPVDQAPNCLGPGFRPSRLISIQPENTTLSAPAQLTLPNDFGAPNGVHMNLMNLDVATGKFIITGVGTVTNNAFVTDPNSGVATFDWFGAQPFQQHNANGKGDHSKPNVIDTPMCSYTSPAEGALEEDHAIPSYNSRGVSRSLVLHYNSRTGNPDSLFSAMMTPNPDTAFLSAATSSAPGGSSTAQGTLSVSASTPYGGGISYYDLGGADSPYLASVRTDFSTAPSGVVPVTYDFTTSVYSNNGAGLQVSGIVSEDLESTAVINGPQLYPALSPGWSYANVDRLVFQTDGSVSLISGSQSAISQYFPFGTSNILSGNLGFELGNLNGYTVFENSGPPPDGIIISTPKAKPSPSGIKAGLHVPVSTRLSPMSQTATVIQNLGSIYPTEGKNMAFLTSAGANGGGEVSISFNLASLPAGTERIAVDADFLSSVQMANAGLSLIAVGIVNYNPRTTATDITGTVLPGGDTGYAWRTGFRTYYIDIPQTAWGHGLNIIMGIGNDQNISNPDVAALIDNIRFETNPSLPVPSGNFVYPGLPEDMTTFSYNPSTQQYLHVFKDGSKQTFDSIGRQIQMADRFGNTTSYTYTDATDSGTAADLASVTDPVGLTTNLSYQGGKLSAISDPASRVTRLTYNQLGQLTQITNPDGTTRGFGYDGNGRMSSQTDGMNQTRFYAYGPSGRMTQVTRADGAVYLYSPANVGGFPTGTTGFFSGARTVPLGSNQNGSTYYVTDPNGHTTATVMDDEDDQVETIDALGQVTSMVYDDQRNEIGSTLPNGCQYQFTYDNFGNVLTKVANFNNAQFTFTYTPTFNLVQTLTDPLGRKTTFSYDSAGDLTQVLNPAGGTLSMTYNGAGQVTSRTDQRGNKTTLTYDALGRLSTVTDPLGGVTTTSYDGAGNPISTTDPKGNVTTFQYDLANKLIVKTAADGGITRYAYDSDKDLIQVTDPLGNTNKWSFNARQWPIAFTDAVGLVTQKGYDGVGNLIALTDPAGGIWNYTYDALDRRQTATDLFGHVTQWTYDPIGNVTALVRPDGSIFANDFDQLSRLVATSAPDGSTTTYTYDVGGENTKIQDPLNGVVQFGYDALGERISVTDQLGRLTKWAYDPVGNLIESTLPDSTSASFAYDNDNRRITSTTADGGSASFAYDPDGNLTSLKDSNGATRQFSYDPVNRPVAETDPLGLSRVKSYDLAGNLVSLTRKDGAVITYTYDADHRLTQKGLPGIGSTPGDQLSYSYDALSNIVSAGNNGSLVSNQYDAMSHLLGTSQTVGGNVQSLTFSYDQLWRRVQMADPLGLTTYAYDNRDRLTNLVDASGAGFSFAFDSLSRMTGKVYPNGITTTLSYDAASQLTSVAHSGAGTIAQATYTYNSVGNRNTELREDGNTRTFAYDQVSRVEAANSTLSGVANEMFGYDKEGNQTNSGQQFDAANKLLNDSTYSYSYDREGNLTGRQNLTNPSDQTSLAYDAENRLRQVSVGPTNSPVSVVSYTYDANGRRITKTVNGILTRYVLDADNVRLELNASNQVTASEAYSSEVDDLLMRIGGNGTAFVHSDGLGSSIALTNSSGAVTERYRYSAFGVPTVLNPDFSAKTTNVSSQPFTYTGREWEQESGLYFYRERYYVPSIGRFSSEDPLRLAAGRNYYDYVGDNPINSVDPFGELSSMYRHTWAPGALSNKEIGGYVGGLSDIAMSIAHPINTITAIGNISAAYIDTANRAWSKSLIGYNYHPKVCPDPILAKLISDAQNDPIRALTRVIGGLVLGGVTESIAGEAIGSVGAFEDPPISVIGHYPDYENLALDMNANYFNIPPEEWEAMTEGEQWAANQQFLDDAIARGDTFVLATPLNQMRPGSFFESEVQYLVGNGYTLNADGSALVAP